MTWARISSRERRLFLSGLRRARPVISLICASTSSAAEAKFAAPDLPARFGGVAGAVVCCAKPKEAKLAAKARSMSMRRANGRREREIEVGITFSEYQIRRWV